MQNKLLLKYAAKIEFNKFPFTCLNDFFFALSEVIGKIRTEKLIS